MLGGSFRGGKNASRTRFSGRSIPPPLFHFCTFSVHSALHERAFSECVCGEGGGGFGETTPSLNPPTAVDSKLKKVLLQTPISGLHWEANFKLQSKDDSVGGEKKKKKQNQTLHLL